MISRLLFVTMVLLPLTAMAADLNIFDVRKNLPMSDSDPVYRDFYLDGGSESGVSVGMVFTVYRRMPLYDTYQNRAAGDLQLKVAKLKIIHVQRGLSVGRLQSEFTRESAPLLEDPFIMIGDRIDLTSGSSDKKAEASSESAPNTAQEQPTPRSSTNAQIVVNSVDLSSHAPQEVEAPSLQ
jgi:hypothetical protein